MLGILDIIAAETGGERQYSEQYAISYKGSHYHNRKQEKPVERETIYRAEYEDGNFEIFSYCTTDSAAYKESLECEKEHGELMNLFEVDENYDEIRTVF